MRSAGRVLLQACIDEEGADLQLQRLPFRRPHVPLGRGPFAKSDDVRFRDSSGSPSPEKKTTENKKRTKSFAHEPKLSTGLFAGKVI
jgi:hypothetical protein